MRTPHLLAAAVTLACTTFFVSVNAGCNGQRPGESAAVINTQIDATGQQLAEVAANPATDPKTAEIARKAAAEIARTKVQRDAAVTLANTLTDENKSLGEKIAAGAAAGSVFAGPYAPIVGLGGALIGGIVTGLGIGIKTKPIIANLKDQLGTATDKLTQVTGGIQAVVDANPSLVMPSPTAPFAADANHVVSVMRGQAQDPVLDGLTPSVP